VHWLHNCSVKLNSLYMDLEDRAILDAFRLKWAQSTYFSYTAARYMNCSPLEFCAPFILPEILKDPYLNLLGSENRTSFSSLRWNISLHSDSFVVFVQTLFPWSEVDKSGLHSKPVKIDWLSLKSLVETNLRVSLASFKGFLWRLCM